MRGGRDVRRIARAIDLAAGIVGRDRLPEPRNPGGRQRIAERDRPPRRARRGLPHAGRSRRTAARRSRRARRPGPHRCAAPSRAPRERCRSRARTGRSHKASSTDQYSSYARSSRSQHGLRHATLAPRGQSGRPRGGSAHSSARSRAANSETGSCGRTVTSERSTRRPTISMAPGRSTSSSATACAATSSAKLPANAPSRSNTRCSTGLSRP